MKLPINPSQGIRVMMKALQSATKKMNRPVGGLPSFQNLSPITKEVIFVDSPDTVKNLFVKDINFAKEVGGQIKNQEFRAPRFRDTTMEQFSDPISLEELNNVKSEIYNLTQSRLKDLPEFITVYRAGKLNEEDGVSSFSLDPNYNVETNLPWQKGRDEPLIPYQVKKSDILASPDFAEGMAKGRAFDEQEVIIDNNLVQKNNRIGVLPENEKLRKEFNIDAFHGTNQQVAINPVITKDGRRVLVEEDYQPIKEFIDKGEYEGDTPSIQDIGNWFSEDPKVADYFSRGGENAQIYPVKLRLKNPKEYFSYEELEEEFEDFMEAGIKAGKSFDLEDGIGSKAFRENLQNQGHDGIIITRSTTDTGEPRKDYVVFEAKNIRSKFAMFDPKKSESGDIMANIAGATTLGALAGLEDST